MALQRPNPNFLITFFNDKNPKGFVKIPIHAVCLGELLQKANYHIYQQIRNLDSILEVVYNNHRNNMTCLTMLRPFRQVYGIKTKVNPIRK